MTEPIYGQYFEQLWGRLPEVYRTEDANVGWQLKRYLYGVGAPYDSAMNLFERFLYVAPNDRSRLAPKPQLSSPIQLAYPDMLLSPDDGTTWIKAADQFNIIDDGHSGGKVIYDDTVLSVTDDGNGLGTMTWDDDNNDTYTATVAADGASVEFQWSDAAISSESFYELSGPSDGAYAAASQYLQAGTYRMTFDYIDFPANGVAVITIDEKVVGMVQLQNGGTYSILTSFPITFTTNRGYTTIKVVYMVKYQTNPNAVINIGDINIVNTATPDDFHTTADLVDPYAADAAWLPWLAQLVGVVLDQSQNPIVQRASIINAYGGINAGTKTAIANAIQPFLTGTRFIRIYNNSTQYPLGTGGEWDVLIVTREEEVPANIDIVTLAMSLGVKPAGVKLWHANYTTTWSELQTDRPTWADWNGSTWQQIVETGWSGT